LPDTLVVRLAEREPLALWQNQGKVALIDGTGAVIPGAPLAAFQDFPLVAGKDAPTVTAELLGMLREAPTLAARVTAVRYVESRRWDLIIDDRVQVELPQYGARRAWLRLAREERAHALFARDILAINVRNADQWVFRLPPGGRLRMTLQNGDG
jgi:cell division protein FtsQ